MSKKKRMVETAKYRKKMSPEQKLLDIRKKIERAEVLFDQTQHGIDHYRKTVGSSASFDDLSSEIKRRKAELVALQREFNEALAGCGSSEYRPYIIDTFGDTFLHDETDRMTPVEIDIERRLQLHRAYLERAEFVGENDLYQVYHCDLCFLRREKASGKFVFLGRGFVPAAVYGEWLYVFNKGSMLGDHYIRRIRLDGQLVEQFDWLSNEKKGVLAGRGMAHIVSEDQVTEMYLDSGSLVIRVDRLSVRNGYYRIVVTLDGDVQRAERVVESGAIPAFTDALDMTPMEE